MNKQNELFQLILQLKINSKENLSKEIFKDIKRLARTKGGFLTNENRRILWEVILNIESRRTRFKRLILNNDNEPMFDYTDWNQFRNCDVYNTRQIDVSEANTIRKDIPRTNNLPKIKNAFRNINYASLYYFYSMKSFGYEYYQGCLDVFYYFINLYPENDCIQGINAFQIYSELFLKDFLINVESKGKQNMNALSTVGTIIENFLYDISKESYNFLNELDLLCSTAAVLAWVICSFAHSIDNECVEYRVLDFLLCHNKIFPYLISAYILHERIEKYKEGLMPDEDIDAGMANEVIFKQVIINDDIEGIINKTYRYYKKNKNRLMFILNKTKEAKVTLPYLLNQSIKGTSSLMKKKKPGEFSLFNSMIIFLILFLFIYYYRKYSQ